MAFACLCHTQTLIWDVHDTQKLSTLSWCPNHLDERFRRELRETRTHISSQFRYSTSCSTPVGVISRLLNHLMSLYTVLSDNSRGRTRTYDPLINSQMLPPTELHGNIISISYKIKEKTSKGICIGILHIPLSYTNIIT